MNMRNFADLLADKEGGIYIKPGKSRSKMLTRDEVMEIFGEVPNYSVRYGLIISVVLQKDGNYKLTVRRERNQGVI